MKLTPSAGPSWGYQTVETQNTMSTSRASFRAANILGAFIRAIFRCAVVVRKHPQKKLRLAESLSLGERRFVAIVEYGRARFLIGGSASSIGLLTQLADGPCDDPETIHAPVTAGEARFR